MSATPRSPKTVLLPEDLHELRKWCDQAQEQEWHDEEGNVLHITTPAVNIAYLFNAYDALRAALEAADKALENVAGSGLIDNAKREVKAALAAMKGTP